MSCVGFEAAVGWCRSATAGRGVWGRYSVNLDLNIDTRIDMTEEGVTTCYRVDMGDGETTEHRTAGTDMEVGAIVGAWMVRVIRKNNCGPLTYY